MANRTFRDPCAARSAAWLATASLLALSLAACGGGSSPPPANPNPVPTITALSPSSATAGGPSFTLTVTGTDFVSSSSVRWNGASRTTTFASSTQLSATITAADIAAGGTAQVTVFNPSPGGGPSESFAFTINNPAPSATTLSPASAVATGPGFTLTVIGSNFASTSVVEWNGSDRSTTFVSKTQLNATIAAADIANPGTAQVTVFTPPPGGGPSNALTFTITSLQPLAITTSSLPPSAAGKAFNFVLASTGGAPPITWGVSAGSLPLGLALDSATGRITGKVNGGTASFTVQAADSATTLHVATRDLGIQILPSLGRNDGVCTQGSTDQPTPISNGTLRASISPYGDIDVYSFHGTAGAQVTMEIFAQRLDLDGDPSTQDSYLDSMMELLDSNCQTLSFNDDIDPGNITDSKISVSSTPFPPPCTFTPCADVPPPTSLPYTGTYYIRVRDFRSDGRPDLIYELSLSGAD